MLPEGSDKFGVLHTYFTLGRRSSKELSDELNKSIQNSNVLHKKIMTV